MMEIRLAADLQTDSIVDGPGIRTVIWTQGCPHKCKGCHNPGTHSFDDGVLVDVEEVKEALKEVDHQTGVTFSGGDPMCQPEACLELAKYCHELGLNIWLYTGYTYEQLKKLSKHNEAIMDLLSEIDVLVDGKFILEEKSLNLKFKGSENQRVIDMKATLQKGYIVLYENDVEENSNKSKKDGVYI